MSFENGAVFSMTLRVTGDQVSIRVAFSAMHEVKCVQSAPTLRPDPLYENNTMILEVDCAVDPSVHGKFATTGLGVFDRDLPSDCDEIVVKFMSGEDVLATLKRDVQSEQPDDLSVSIRTNSGFLRDPYLVQSEVRDP